MSNKDGGMDALNKIIDQLKGKKTQKAKKQLANVKKYMKDEGIKIKEKVEPKVNHRKPMYLKESMLHSTIRKRDITEDGEVCLIKNPLLVLVKLGKANSELTHTILKELEKENNQCLCYPELRYNAYNHGLILSCELCYNAFTIGNKFCEIMVKTIRLCGYGMTPEINNPRWNKGD